MEKYYNYNLESFINYNEAEIFIEPIFNEDVVKFFNNSTEYIYNKIIDAVIRLYVSKIV